MDVQRRILASAILYRATLRALVSGAGAPGDKSRPAGRDGDHKPTAEEKMALHARVEEAAWELPDEMLGEIEGREVDDGPPETDAWRALVARLARDSDHG